MKCSECGKFCKSVDSGTYFGSVLDLEPPDPDYFCQECVNKKIEEPYSVISQCWWIKPNYVYIAKSIIRHYKKINKNI